MTSCTCCGGRLAATTYRDEFVGEPLGHCATCGHLQVTVFPTAEQLADYYDRKYSEARSKYVDDKYLAVMHKRAIAQCDFIERGGVSLRGLRVADVGCGYGELLAELARRGAEAVGYEYDPACVEHGRSRGLRIERISSESDLDGVSRVDLITLSHTLEHMRDVAGTLPRLATKAANLFVEVPRYELELAAMFRDQEGHLHFFIPGSLRRLLERHHLEPHMLVPCGPELGLYWNDQHAMARKVARMVTRDWFFGDYGTARPGGMWIRSLSKVAR